MNSAANRGPVRYVVDERLDFNHFVPLTRSYVVASSYRSGSQYLCWRLWQTGLLGAPSEVLNPTSELRILMNRFKTSSPADYFAELLGRRTTRNGVFGMKAHFHHFESFLKDYPPLLEVLSPISYIYISRHDKIAQAVSMAKALQTDTWTSRMDEGVKPALHYDRDLITNCLADIELQDSNWRRWFETHNVTPFQVTYDELTANAARVVKSIVEFLGVQDDEPDEVNVPPAKKQGDETNQDWVARFERETRARARQLKAEIHAGAARPPVGVSAGAAGAAGAAAAPAGAPEAHLFDRYSHLARSFPASAASATGFLDVLSLRRRYDVIVGRNRALFQNARVLDLMSSHGFWSLAALDAGAAHVVGLERSPVAIDTATSVFKEYDIRPDAYSFVQSDVAEGLAGLPADSFDVILCLSGFEQSDFRLLFDQFRRLRPRYVILDTWIVLGEGPLARFSLGIGEALAAPNHLLIMFLCDAFGFRWNLVDWRGIGIVDWTGIHEYERDQRRTYVLERPD